MSARLPPTRSPSIEFDATLGSRPSSRYNSAKPAVETTNATPRRVRMTAMPRRAMGGPHRAAPCGRRYFEYIRSCAIGGERVADHAQRVGNAERLVDDHVF